MALIRAAWLVLEKWMTPSLFEGLAALDETAYCVELGERAGPLLKQHWDSFITPDDFAWLAKTGINAVRIPIVLLLLLNYSLLTQ